MRAYSEQQIDLSLPVKGTKVSKRDHLNQVKKATGKTPQGLTTVWCPQELAYLWSWFCNIKQAEPITYAELIAWGQLTGNQPTPFEVEMLRMIDNIHTKVNNDRS